MRLAIVSFVAACCAVQNAASLPSLWPLLLLAMALLLLIWLPRFAGWRALLTVLLAANLGVLLSSWRAELRLAHWLPVTQEAQALLVEGRVVGLPQSTPYGPRFRFDVESTTTGWRGMVLLNDYGKVQQDWRPGQRWRLLLRLKRPHGNANPGGFDYQAWLLSEGIAATGSVSAKQRQLLSELSARPDAWLDRLRMQLQQRIERALGDAPYRGVVTALVVGEQSGISQSQWQLFRDSGLTHLVSISGLHITLLAGLVGSLVAWSWRRFPRLSNRLPSRQAALMAGVFAALAYSLLAGFSVPTQRTLYMLAAAALALWSGRRFAISTIWCLALGLTVLLDPWAVLSAGFWLSFLTVGAILFAFAGRQGPPQDWRSKLRHWGWAQWAATLGSLPLLLALFQQLPLISPLANALAIPLIGSLATPLALLGSIEPSGWLLQAAHAVIAFTMACIEPLLTYDWQWRQSSPAHWSVLLAALGVLACLLPRGLPWRFSGLALLLPLLWPTVTAIKPRELRASVLDVGQGLAVLLQTERHAMLFDTGPRGSGSRVLPAALRAAGVQRLDLLLLSHDDGDHLGAAETVLNTLPVKALLGTLPRLQQAVVLPARRPCQAGLQWQWDGVLFRVLHPLAPLNKSASDNEQSCVLQVQIGNQALLIPADIGRREELQLVDYYGGSLRSTVLILPHHGSKTSSDEAFISAVAPKLAIATVGYHNPFRHPRDEVVARYQANGATVWRTDHHGAVLLQMGPHATRAQTWRALRPRYWSAAVDQSALLTVGTQE